MKAFKIDFLTALVAAVLLAVGAVGLSGALAQVGKPFPGFLLLENRVVASIGLSLWPATVGGEIFQSEIVAAEGVPLARAEELTQQVRALPVGTPVEYRMRQGQEQMMRVIPTREFGWRDFLMLYGFYLLNALAIGVGALVAVRRRRFPEARACVPLLLTAVLWVLTALDLYGPYHLFRLHALCEALLFPAALVMALYFPLPARILARLPWLPGAAYGVAALLALVYQVGLRDPEAYVATHLLSVSAFGVALLALVVAEVERFRRPMTLLARERLRIVAIGALVALAVPIAFSAAEFVTGGRSPQNALAITGVIFPFALAYALSRGRYEATAPIHV
jgi:hypothetical protein